MSGILSGVDYSVLFASKATSDASSNILNALYNGATAASSTAVSTGNPITDLKLAQKNQTADIAQEAKNPQVLQDISAFKKAVSQAKDIKTALLNPNVQKVLLTANGLSKYLGEGALIQKAFLSDPTNSKSLVNQLKDSTLLAAVRTYNFSTTGLAELQNPKVISTLTDAYTEIKWRQSLDVATPGLSKALDFLNQAKSITSATDILTNLVNFVVVTGALGLPQSIANQDYPFQQATLNARLNYKDFQDPKYVTSLTDEYLLTQQSLAQSNTGDLTSLAVHASGLLV